MSAPAPARASPDRRPVVLYVEDHPVNVMIMEAMLNHRPHLRLVVATTGEEGLQAARIERPDLLLLDFHLPDCDGAELLVQLRAVTGLEGTPAVAVSATDDAARRLVGSSFCEFWAKPLDVHRTLGAIDRLIDDPPQPRVLQDAPGLAHAR